MKKISLIVCLVAVAAFALTGCGNNKSAKENSVSEQAVQEDVESAQEEEIPVDDAEEPVEVAVIETVEEYVAAYPEADIIVGEDGSFYVEATKINWVTELDLADTEEVAVIERTGVDGEFQPWDATVLPEQTVILHHNQEDSVLVAVVDGEPIPYLAYEG